MKRLEFYIIAAGIMFIHSLVFAQRNNPASEVADYRNQLIEKIKSDGPGIPRGRSRFEVSIGRHTSMAHWKTGAWYIDRRTDCYWAAFYDNKCGLAIAELADCGAFKVLNIGLSNGIIHYKIKVLESFDKTLACLQQHPGFINIASVAPEEKIAPTVREWQDGKSNSAYKKDTNRIVVSVVFKDVMPAEEKMNILKGTADSVWLLGLYDPLGIILALVTKEQIMKISEFEQVDQIYEYYPPMPTNDFGRPQTRVSVLQSPVIDTISSPPSPTWNSGRQYTGDSVWIGIWDTGIDDTHWDFNESVSGVRVPRRAAIPGITDWTYDYGGHGTHVAGIAMGNGWRSEFSMPFGTTNGRRYQWRGVAPKARVWAFDQTYNGCSGDVNNHSHIIDTEGYYTNQDKDVDNVVSNHDPVALNSNNIVVYTTANEGWWGTGYSSQTAYYSLLADAKNPIKVGATEKYTGLIANFSSMGPTRDGRIGPDVMGPGTGGDCEYTVEFDSIAIKGTAGIKKVWRFDNPIQDLWAPSDGARGITISNSVLSVGITIGSTIRSPVITPSFNSEALDTLILRWKTTKKTTLVPTDSFGSFFVVSDGSITCKGVTAMRPPASWQTLKLPFSAMASVDAYPLWGGQSVNSISFCIGTTAPPATGITSGLMGTPNSYTCMEGTSMAAPHVTGIIALMLQRLRDAYGRNIHTNPFWNSTAKAILIHTATDMIQTAAIRSHPNNPDFVLGDAANADTQTTVYGPGPDFATGYGLVNAEKAVQFVDTNRYKERQINKNQTACFFIYIPAGTTSLRTTLCWDDPGIAPPLDPYTKILVNDLDLKLINLANKQISYPWVYDHTRFHGTTVPANGIDPLMTRQLVLANPATKGIDTVNNVEVVDISNPAAGQWMVTVSGTDMKADQNPRVFGVTQDYSLVSDLTIMPDTGQAGLIARYGTSKRVMKTTMSGDMRLKAATCRITGTYQGLLFKSGGTTSESLDTNGVIHATTVSDTMGAWLDVAANLTGGLVFRSSDGQVKAHFSSGSVVRLRGFRRCGTVN